MTIALYTTLYLLPGLGLMFALGKPWSQVEWQSRPSWFEKLTVVLLWPFILVEIAMTFSEEE